MSDEPYSMRRLYGELIKSKQTFLLAYTTGFAYLMSAWPVGIDPILFFWVILGLVLAISGSTMLNMYIDRDIDARMVRTNERPLPKGLITPRKVLVHGLVWTTVGILICGLFINLLTMIVVFFGFFFDVIVYSVLLKRRTKFSILFGGIAGGLPALAGRTTVINLIDPVGVFMALFVITWIPLHILTLSLIPETLEGYRKAGIPMWPVVSGERQTIRVTAGAALLSAVMIVATAMALKIHLFAQVPLILFAIVVISKSISNLRHPSTEKTFKIFKMASMYMAFAFLWLFVGVALTPILNTMSPLFQIA